MNNNSNTRPARKAGSKNRKPSGKPPANKRKQSTIDVNLLTQKAVPQPATEPYVPVRSFNDMPLHKALKAAIAQKGFTTPTEIQDKTMDHLLLGKDLLGIAQTGTGKTGAFLVPIIHRLLEAKGNFQVLVMAPTRELAVQVEQEFKSLTTGMSLYSSCFIGGTNLNRDLQSLRRKSHLTVGTPGRLQDLAQRKALRFSDFKILVLDEFDRMLDMGFKRDVERIIGAMHNRKQTLLFSATLDKQQQSIINNLLTNPLEIKVSSGEATGSHIDQEIIKVAEGENKFQVLTDLLQQPGFNKVLVFAETKRWVSRVRKSLNKTGILSDEIHGNKSQNYRQQALKRFENGNIQVLVATDVAARGLDITDVTHVINYQLPASLDTYIHRIGRTGRAGKTGKAYTFVN